VSSTPSPTMILRRVFFERAVQRSIQRSVQTAALIGATPHALVLARGSTDNQAPEFEAVRPRRLRFPEDHGAHPGFRTEWWYLTGWLERQDAPPVWRANYIF
jgi:predicted secreted hydrolase